MKTILAILVATAFGLTIWLQPGKPPATKIPQGRSEVVFWHFWGGEDRDVVEDVVRRFNASQETYFVRAVAMPGNNLQAKLYLSVAGGDPPDLVNQDDPVIADWAHRGVIYSLHEIAPPEEVAAVQNWMLDSAQRLSVYDDRMFGVCNGLDIRALYYNKTLLDQHGLSAPKTIEQLDQIATTIAPASQQPHPQYGYLPDTRRLWAWGYVFGGDFYDPKTQTAQVNSQANVAALEWMARYRDRYGADNIAAFRKGDQSLPGKTFPLLPIGDDQMSGRYGVVMDGQWRVRNLVAFQKKRREQGISFPEFGVCPLPTPSISTARENAGWVNGNFFVVPKNARNTAGAWEFAKFWIGYTDASQAAKTCASGGWIPVSQQVIDTPEFKSYLKQNPLFQTFVDLAGSPNQFPTPLVVGAAKFKRTVDSVAFEALNNDKQSPRQRLDEANQQIQSQLDRHFQSSRQR